MRKVFLLFIFLILFFKAPSTAFADNEFASDYKVSYDIQTSGVSEVTENITLKNLTERYYASNFNLTIGATKISDVRAFDSQGNLESSLSKDVGAKVTSSKSVIKVKFNQQVVGKDKTYSFTLKFKSSDFAEKQGQVWQITIPKISTVTPSENYSLSLLVPENFGDPTSIVPEPKKQSDENGKLKFDFNKDQITTTGVLANFGSSQLYHFKLGYSLKNDSFLPALAKIPLPPDTSYQQVIISNLEPTPENVNVDVDGNYIAWYKVNAKSFVNISVEGLAKLHFNPSYKEILTPSQLGSLTSSQRYWEKDNPIIKAKILEIFEDKNPTTVKEKAYLINQFVVDYLKYNDTRVKSGDFERLGALTILSNPEKALCGEFTDLFIALARSENIPTRELIGFASSSNQDLRPLSFADRPLHAWPEYYDKDNGWVMIDPTWQNTSGGVDYFNKIDLNHFVMAIRGDLSLEPNPSNEVDVSFSDVEFKPLSKMDINITSNGEFFSGLPSKAEIKLENKGSRVIQTDKLLLSSLKLKLSPNNISVPLIPPYGHVVYKVDVRTGTIFESYQDFIEAVYGRYVSRKSVSIKPFFSYKAFPFIVALFVIFVFGFYFIILHLHRTKFHKVTLPIKK